MDFRNKYLKYDYEITFDIFQKVWDKLISFGYRPFNDSSSIKRYNEFKNRCCFLKTTKDHPMEFSCYSGVVDSFSETTVQEILGYDPFVRDDDFVLPEKWYVSVTNETVKDINMFKSKTCWKEEAIDYKAVGYEGVGYNSPPNDYTEITFDQFKKYVLKQDVDVEIEQDDICKYCETNIIGGSGNTQHFQCEGRYCQRAKEELIETIDNSKDQTKQAVHCETQEQWDFVIEKVGYNNLSEYVFNKDKFGSCIILNSSNHFGSFKWATKENYQILSFSDWCAQNNYEFQSKATSLKNMFDFNVSEQTANDLYETIDRVRYRAMRTAQTETLDEMFCASIDEVSKSLDNYTNKNKVQISTDNEIKINIIQKQSIKI